MKNINTRHRQTTRTYGRQPRGNGRAGLGSTHRTAIRTSTTTSNGRGVLESLDHAATERENSRNECKRDSDHFETPTNQRRQRASYAAASPSAASARPLPLHTPINPFQKYEAGVSRSALPPIIPSTPNCRLSGPLARPSSMYGPTMAPRIRPGGYNKNNHSWPPDPKKNEMPSSPSSSSLRNHYVPKRFQSNSYGTPDDGNPPVSTSSLRNDNCVPKQYNPCNPSDDDLTIPFNPSDDDLDYQYSEEEEEDGDEKFLPNRGVEAAPSCSTRINRSDSDVENVMPYRTSETNIMSSSNVFQSSVCIGSLKNGEESICRLLSGTKG